MPLPVAAFLFVPFFIGFWVLATFVIAKTGWAGLSKRFRWDGPFTGTRIGVISAFIGIARYKNSLVMHYNTDGLYLRPILIFRPFHPAVFIPWAEIKEVKSIKLLFTSTTDLIIGSPKVARISVRTSTLRPLEGYLPRPLSPGR